MDFWEQRYKEGVTPWEGASFPDVARRFFREAPPGRLLLPGCGGAGDMPELMAAGHEVLAIDFSEAALAHARSRWPNLSDKLLLKDFFKLEQPAFDYVFERAFLCALPIKMRMEYSVKMASLIRPGGLLAGVFFVAASDRGPPFGIAESELEALVGKWFSLEFEQSLPDGLPVFRGMERWMVWKRRSVDLDQAFAV
ncbi:methyltransferase domain-containing protein [Chromobacterium sp. IIBBL 290-4]|uniref:methyltransferase domain-containing protein n=1 Tax=Chromobacterium sp. IIBBL 290-4 TaxID=2953890 RepID=UPI0020B74B13|nr:methyltransferase domain-containing protein [Chromobacterium sp. IIBBL 290-4]UTH74731.1 TPMT family class I SAM-dependent methyltransferase [Chromobacterium sp. IIBBL 290-4]